MVKKIWYGVVVQNDIYFNVYNLVINLTLYYSLIEES